MPLSNPPSFVSGDMASAAAGAVADGAAYNNGSVAMEEEEDVDVEAGRLHLEPMDFGAAGGRHQQDNEAAAARSDSPNLMGLGAGCSSQQQQQQQRPPSYQVEGASLDVEQLAGQFEGQALTQRLLYVADHSSALAADVLCLLIGYLQKTCNTAAYQQAHQKLEDCLRGEHRSAVSNGCGGGPDLLPTNEQQRNAPVGYVFDQHWVEQTVRSAHLKLDKLDQDLKHYKSNSIKESIRRGQDDLGEHYLEMGNLAEALKCFSRSRDYCTSPKHLVTMCLNVIKVSIYLLNWSLVANYIQRAEGALETSVGKQAANSAAAAASQQQAKENSAYVLKTRAKLRAAAGLSELCQGKYKSAARSLLQVDFDQFAYSEVMSPNNVAVYGALCALATFERPDLRQAGQPAFAQFLECEPAVGQLLRTFHQGHYRACLFQLEQLAPNLLLDPYLAPQLDALRRLIRSRAMVQYFSPYSSAELGLMAEAFLCPVQQLESELSQLILAGQIEARIDSDDKLIHAQNDDRRAAAHRRALRLAALLRRRTRSLALRAALQRARIGVRNPVGQSSAAPPPTQLRPPPASSSSSSMMASDDLLPPPTTTMTTNKGRQQQQPALPQPLDATSETPDNSSGQSSPTT